jgi:hypothetical protein
LKRAASKRPEWNSRPMSGSWSEMRLLNFSIAPFGPS